MATYQDVITSQGPAAAWSLTEAAGTDFAPYIGGSHLTLIGACDYRQAGPAGTDFSVRLHVGGKLSLAFISQVSAPDTIEVWAKFSAAPPPVNTAIYHNGNWTANGTGLWVLNTGHLVFGVPAAGNLDTGFVLSNTNWHLYHVSAQAGNVATVAVDGVIYTAKASGVPIAPNPNTLFLGGDSTAGATQLLNVAWPAFFTRALSAIEMSTDDLAMTSPNVAILQTLAGVGSNDNTLLLEILNAVRKTFPTT